MKDFSIPLDWDSELPVEEVEPFPPPLRGTFEVGVFPPAPDPFRADDFAVFLDEFIVTSRIMRMIKIICSEIFNTKHLDTDRQNNNFPHHHVYINVKELDYQWSMLINILKKNERTIENK